MLGVGIVGALSPRALAGTVSLDGEWLFYPVPGEVREASDTKLVDRLSGFKHPKVKWEKIRVPGYWDQQPGGWPWSEPTLPGGPHPEHDGEAWYRLYFKVPPEAYPRLEQGAVIMRTAKNSKTARVFLDYVRGPEGRGIFARHGFLIP